MVQIASVVDNKYVDMINGTRYTFQDFAMAVKVEKVALPDLPKAEVTIHGISLETMSQITCLTFKKNAQTPNKLIIEAGYSKDMQSKLCRRYTEASAGF